MLAARKAEWELPGPGLTTNYCSNKLMYKAGSAVIWNVEELLFPLLPSLNNIVSPIDAAMGKKQITLFEIMLMKLSSEYFTHIELNIF